MLQAKVWVWLAILVSGLALASPAQDLFDEVNGLLSARYGGVADVRPAALVQKYQAQLEQSCKEDTACPSDKAISVIRAMINELGDKHTNYYTPDDYKNYRETLRGGVSSNLQIGVVTQTVGGYEGLVVTEVVGGGPAEQAGIRRGDRMVAVDSDPFPKAESERIPFLRSKVGSGNAIRITLERSQGKVEVELKGRNLPLVRLPFIYYTPENVAIMRVPSFMGSYSVIGPKIHELVRQAQAKEATGLVIDLRNNGGGLLSECIVGAGAFVDESYRRFKSATNSTEYNFKAGAFTLNGRPSINFQDKAARWKGPVVILVNRRTASCSEFFTFDLQENGVAKVIGEPTAGVGNSVTEILPLSNGGGIQITTTVVLHRDNTPYPDLVTPDIAFQDDLIALASGRDVMLEEALKQLLGVDTQADQEYEMLFR
jgi:carboxyl-terminal processing protease